MVGPSESIHLGQFMIVVDTAGSAAANDTTLVPMQRWPAFDAPFSAPLLQNPQLNSEAFAVRSDWLPEEGAAPRSAAAPLMTEAALLDAFCAGAGLDASSFAGHDPAEMMQRVGAIYRQVVLGLGDLMTERTVGESRIPHGPHHGERGRQQSVQMGRRRSASPSTCFAGVNDKFLSGPAALKASFEDLKKHLLCLLAGSRAAVGAALDASEPSQCRRRRQGPAHDAVRQGRGLLARITRSATQDLGADARASAESLVNRAFKSGYERQLRELDEMGTLA